MQKARIYVRIICRQTLTSPRETMKRKIDYDSRLERKLVGDEQKDIIESWVDLCNYCKELEGLSLLKGDDSLPLQEINGMSPALAF